jgi:GNAT superfamily N-acetyltransferase
MPSKLLRLPYDYPSPGVPTENEIRGAVSRPSPWPGYHAAEPPADDRVPCRQRWRHRCGDFAAKIEPGRKLTIAEPAAIGSRDDAFTDLERFVMSDVVVFVEDEISQNCRSAINDLLGEFSVARGFEFRPIPICLSLREGDRITGGVIGHTNWEWLYTETLAVATHLHGLGYGRQLMERAEAIARTRNCVGVWVDTCTFQSPGFYERLGYRIFGTLPSYPGGEQRIFLMKMF